MWRRRIHRLATSVGLAYHSSTLAVRTVCGEKGKSDEAYFTANVRLLNVAALEHGFHDLINVIGHDQPIEIVRRNESISEQILTNPVEKRAPKS
jgi:hypothetical protein